MFLKRLFAPRKPTFTCSPDLPGHQADWLLQEMRDCIDRKGGPLTNVRRAQALADLFEKLSPEGQRIYAGVLDGLNDAAAESVGDKYSRIEEAEMFGGSASKLAVLDTFETPRRRMIAFLLAAEGGTEIVGKVGFLANAETQDDIEYSIK